MGRWSVSSTLRVSCSAPLSKISFLIALLSRTDANRFGQAYLEKFGWDASKGLGSSGEGRTSAIKAMQKLDMLGIGMQHQKDPNGIAWRQNRDFENLLRRLNEGTNAVTGPFHKAREEESLKGWGEGGEQTSTSETDQQKMNEDERDGDEDENERGGDEDEVVAAKKEKKKKKKRKTAEALEEEDPLDKKKRKKRKKLKDGDDHAGPSDESEPPLAPCPSASSAQKESGSVPTTAVTAPVPIRAPYVAPHIPRIFFGQEANRTSVPLLPTEAHARTAPASLQPNAWRRQIRLRSPRFSASRPLPLLPFPPRTPPLPLLLPLPPPPSLPLKSKSHYKG